MKIIFQTIFLFLIFSSLSISGEPGDMPGQNKATVEEVFTEETTENEGMDVSNVNEILEPKNTEVVLPKNRLEQIFNQYFLAELNKNELTIIGECEKNIADGYCYVVEPSQSSNHFNNYYFYANSQNQVYSIIAFSDKKQGDLNNCKNKINMWKNYFENFDLTEKEPTNNPLNFIMTDAPQKNSLEIFASCYTEQFRDITSSFSIKFYKNI